MIEYGADDLGFQPTGDLPLGIVVPPPVPGNDTSSPDYESFDYNTGDDRPVPIPEELGSRVSVRNRARGSSGRPAPPPVIQEQPSQNRGQNLRQPVTSRPRPRTTVPPPPAPAPLAAVPRRPAPVPAVSRRPLPFNVPEQPKVSSFEAFQTNFDLPRDQIQQLERQNRPVNVPQRKVVPSFVPTTTTTTQATTTATPVTTIPFRFRPQEAIRPAEQLSRPVEQSSRPVRLRAQEQSVIPRQQQQQQSRPVRIRTQESPRSRPRQQDPRSQLSQLEAFVSSQDTVEENEVVTRRPTRPRNFDPRRQRVSSGSSAPSRPTPSRFTPTQAAPAPVEDRQPLQRTVVNVNRQRGRSRRPSSDRSQDIAPTQQSRPALAARTSPPRQQASRQQQPSNIPFSSFPARVNSAEPTFPVFEAAEVAASKAPVPPAPAPSNIPTFSAFPPKSSPVTPTAARPVPTRAFSTIPEDEPVLPTRQSRPAARPRQPERSFAPTPLPQAAANRPNSNTGGSRFSSFPVQNSPAQPALIPTVQPAVPSAVPTRSSSPFALRPTPSRPTVPQPQIQSRPAADPRRVNFDALIQEFTGGRATPAVPAGAPAPSFFNAIPLDSQQPPRQFRPQPAVPGASFELVTELL